MAFSIPDNCRISRGPLASSDKSGNNGAFLLRTENDIDLFVIASDGEGWEHVSVHARDGMQQRTPTWDEMCFVKSKFWSDEDCVVQFHPPRRDYVNVHPHVLHLWRPIGSNLPTPHQKLV